MNGLLGSEKTRKEDPIQEQRVFIYQHMLDHSLAQNVDKTERSMQARFKHC